jgi:hypothetical protein
VDVSVIKSYLVGLGFKVDRRELTLFNESLKKAGDLAERTVTGMTKTFVAGGVAITGTLAGIAAGFVGLMDHVAQNDLDMQLFARRMFLSTDAARKMKTATDALGFSIEEIVWGPPELAERYRQLIKDQNKMLEALGGAQFEKQMRNLRDVRFEFTRLGVEMRYFTMLVVKDLSKALWGDENALLGKLQQFSDWFMSNMPRIAQSIADKVAPALHDMGVAAGHLWETLSKVDWARLLTDVVKITEALVKTLDFIISHPVLARMLLGGVAGGVAGSVIPGVGTALGAAGGAAFGLGYSVGDLFEGKKSPNKADIRSAIADAARKQGVDPALALAVAMQESGFNPSAVNRASGATGLFQLMPGTAKSLGVDPTNPSQNIQGGIQLLHDMLQRHNGNVGAALKEYGGFVTQDPSDYINRISRYREQFSSPGVGGGGLQPMAYHYTVGDIQINVAQPNATPDQIHHAVRSALEEKLGKTNQRLIAQRQGVFA